MNFGNKYIHSNTIDIQIVLKLYVTLYTSVNFTAIQIQLIFKFHTKPINFTGAIKWNPSITQIVVSKLPCRKMCYRQKEIALYVSRRIFMAA